MPIYHHNSQLTLNCIKCGWQYVDKKVGHGDCFAPPLSFSKFHKNGCPQCGSKDFEMGMKKKERVAGLIDTFLDKLSGRGQ